MKSMLLFLLLAFIMLSCVEEKNRIFRDSILEYTIRSVYGFGEGAVSENQLEKIEALTIQTSDVRSLIGIEKLVNLKSFSLSGDSAFLGPDLDLAPLSLCKNLEEINIKFYLLEEINELHSLPNLRVINIYRSNIQSVPDCVSFPNLTNLRIKRAEISNMEGVISAKSLVQLDLDMNKIQTVTLNNSMSKLLYVNLKSNTISEIDSLRGNISIRELYLDRNNLTTIDWAFSMPGLLKLSIEGNPLDPSTIPAQTPFTLDYN